MISLMSCPLFYPSSKSHINILPSYQQTLYYSHVFQSFFLPFFLKVNHFNHILLSKKIKTLTQVAMLADPIGIPACFSSGDRVPDDPAVTRAGQSVIMSVYRTKLANHSRLITITWCRNPLLLHGLSVSISNHQNDSVSGSTNGDHDGKYTCKVELKPWYFWRKQGSKRFSVDNDGKTVDVFWDLKSAKFNHGETEPSSEYYVAVVYDHEVVLLVGDLKNDAYKKTGCRPALIEPVLVSKKEHIFGRKRFSTRARFHDKGKFHDIVIECKSNSNNHGNKEGSGLGLGSGRVSGSEPEMEVRVDGHVVIHVKHLQWKFRGNECIHINKLRVEVFWDVHDWLFSPGLRHALFIFKPSVPPSSVTSASPSSLSSLMSWSPPSTPSSGSTAEGFNGNGSSSSSEYSLFLYAWKVE